MADGYEYDVFLSYRRSDAVHDWVHKYLKGELRRWLAEELPYDPKVFVDEEIEVGHTWPKHLERALLRSRVMLCVWSPTYFRSSWCMAEWKTMAARQDVLASAGADPPPRLVYPLRFWDGEHFPPEAKATEWRCVKAYANPTPGFFHSEGYQHFLDEVRTICHDLSAILRAAPPWDPTWPVVTPGALSAPPVALPRLA